MALIPADEIKEGISALVKIHGTENPVTDKGLLYLKTKVLSKKQKKEIFEKGPMDIKLKFSCDGVYKVVDEEAGEERSYLTFKILGMKKLDEQSCVPLDDF